jgi:ribose transport system ATP-binding protein
MTDGRVLLQVRGLTKAFGGALALDGVDLTILRGEVHGLLGENGSGKSTLIKILAAYHAPDGGELEVDGREVALPLSSGQPHELGLEFVHQDLGLVSSLTVAENLFMADIVKPANRFFVSWSRRSAQAAAVFARYGVAIDPDAVVESIRPVERALVAIVRALEGLRRDGGDEPTLLVLDEPTVFLPQHEVTLLFDLVRQIAAGGSSVLFVSHDLAEVRQITDRVTALRDGRVAGTVVTAQTSPRELVNLILGQELQEMTGIEQLATEALPVVLEVRGLRTRWLHDVSFELHAGEVLGLTGLVGSGYEDAVYAIFGAIPAEAGTLVVDGVERPLAAMTPPAAMARRMALVPGDRQSTGSIPTLPASDNINLLVLDDYFRAGRLRQQELDGNAEALMHEFDVRPARPDMEYGSFSGGNQQKAMMAKWKQIDPRVMLLHEPTQGVDVGARQQIWSMIRGSTASASTICASSDYEQLAAICDRVGVVARGRLVGYLTGADLTKERIADFCLHSSAGRSVAVPADGAGG